MKHKIYLYIANQQADLGEETLVLMNYAFTDASKPTAVKNSYSRQITLPGTPANDKIFGHFYRLDRRTFSGFNSMRRTPFSIHDDAGRIVQSGYLKLDSVTRKGNIVSGYKVTLYGGLGAFLYALAYDENGDKRNLASLNYLGGGPGELDFKITAANVRAAWVRVNGGTPTEYNSIWDVINFAPAYNGIPEGDFDAGKALAVASNWGLETSKKDGDKTYTPNGGYVIINLAKAHTEWEMKDLRCYLQRPVLSMRAFLVAVDKWATANGYKFDYSAIPVNTYRRLWKTLPMLPSLGAFKQDSGNVTPYYYKGHPVTSGQTLNSYVGFNNVDVNMEIMARLNTTKIAFKCGEKHSDLGLLHITNYILGEDQQSGQHTVIFMQLLGYAGNSVIAASPARCWAHSELRELYTPEQLGEICGYSNIQSAGYESEICTLSSVPLSNNSDLGYYYSFDNHDMEVNGTAINQLRLAIKCYFINGHYSLQGEYQGGTAEDQSWGPFTVDNVADKGINPIFIQQYIGNSMPSKGTDWINPSASASYKSSSALRSGALVEKAKLLASKYTPTDYLLSLATQFGWVFSYDEVTKTLTMMPRDTFFNTGKDTIDLTDMVDRSQDIIITPNYAGARIYKFAPEVAPGNFAEEYARVYGFDYGIQRVDTGYQFDSTPVNLLDKFVFRAAATILENGPYWNTIFVNSRFMPSVFIDAGNTYTMWATDGTAKNFDLPTLPSDTTIEYINEDGHEGYDNEFAWKLNLHDAEGKGIDGEDILCFYSGRDSYPRFTISDDEANMMALNGNKPCWRLYKTNNNISVPNFHRYDTDTEWGVQGSLDFGTPKEANIPIVRFESGSSGYEKAWAAFIRDRYNQDTKVMKCRVNFQGIQVGPELLRRFFYYEGAIWVLNKITNYSLTTWDPVECEFIQVQDKEAYTNGQKWE